MNQTDLAHLVAKASQKIEAFADADLNLDITRGKPSSEQLDLALPLLNNLSAEDIAAYSPDVRNYGGLDGLPEMKAFFKEMTGTGEEVDVLVGGNSSLKLMHDALTIYLRYGAGEKRPPWGKQQAKFICPVPGYDRHFAVCEHLGMEMIAVGMDEHGPDMDAVEALVASDNSIKGMWCVPKYSNPTGITYSDEVIERLAKMTAAADGFRIFWDNAYCVHHLGQDSDQLADIFKACAAAKHPQRVVMFSSTSKITFAGAGVAAIIASPENIAWLTKHFGYQMIGPDKINQLRHVRFFNEVGLENHMNDHAEILKPRFDAVLQRLEEGLAGTGLAQWTNPTGGYFISLDVLPGCAKNVVAECARLGLKLTPAGSAYPYGRDEYDTNIRIAPSFPTLEDVEKAADVLVAVVQKVCGERKLSA
ncbi:aminotransferase class I/II-fold pyridoxal phosphate-dependent enzyme [Suttonella sp. R2A3]|uniref:aminotransferase class I/II-fold pyridoxal phosphate-dependent enzyme n=1 Tax=Suttonella sp. R2A3 TaxID=2908648 RepID=UPI001F172F0F|nr:aminotransferase class I/II-fold pyridoxal phosphate-dependent enzyme [Suttonella sp. R2A3]UJF24665.1 aminotransferase class I/II-fold pyridoxal phosphate-dependent enzyme [Suttonella sp. R2A3]